MCLEEEGDASICTIKIEDFKTELFKNMLKAQETRGGGFSPRWLDGLTCFIVGDPLRPAALLEVVEHVLVPGQETRNGRRDAHGEACGDRFYCSGHPAGGEEQNQAPAQPHPAC